MNCHSLTLLPRRVLRVGLIVAFATALAGVALGASETKRYEVPAGPATATLKQFSQQSGEQIVYPTDLLRDVQTRTVSGELTARAALEQMLEGTGLVVVQDARTGALTIRTAADAEKIAAERSGQLIKLQEHRVLGSRIRQTESAGPSPVNVYDQEYIRATGAMTLADFLNYLPQNYAGISAGRGSAPNELNPDFGQRTETSFPSFNFVLGASAANPSQTGVSGVSLRGLGSGSTLVLVDGRRAAQSGARNSATDSGQGFVDLNTIPFGMIERIEIITDGASAIYGADAVAGVINIVLKKNWVGNELSGSFKGAFDGGGRERLLTATTGFVRGKLRGSASISYYDRADLKASQRSFSRNQDHRHIIVGTDANGNPVTARDLRLNWGYPAVVQAAAPANVAGEFNALPGVRVVLVPEGAATTPTVAQFIPVTTPAPGQTIVNAAGQRRGNTAEFLDLLPAAERYSFTGTMNYDFSERLSAYGSYFYTDSRGRFNSQPPVSSASATSGFGNFSTLVPAAMNPFAQNVIVGMVHYEFGSISQRTKTTAHSGTFGLRGSIGQSWQWDSGVNVQRQKSEQISRNFNGAAITGLLNNPDPSLRLNPFIDARVAGVDQSAIYERAALYPSVRSGSRLFQWDFQANGDVVDIWGGTVKAAFGGLYSQAKNNVETVAFSTAVTPVMTTTRVAGEQDSHALFGELSIPVFGRPNAIPLFRRLDLQIAARYESFDRAGSATVPKYGFSWAPIEALLFRASFSESYRAPALTEYQNILPPFFTNVTDPRRTPASTPNVEVSRGSRESVGPETSDNEFYGVVYEPPFLKGLNLSVNYYRTSQKNLIQLVSAQTIVNNEPLFADRIIRAAPDANDLALGQPGPITHVDQTFVNFGRVKNESLDFVLDYTLPSERFGRWRIGGSASRTLTAERQLAPGQPTIVDEGDTFAPPKWKYNASVFWNRGPWNGSLFVSYLGAFKSNGAGNSFLTHVDPSPSVYKVDVRGGYEFRQGIWRDYGKGLRIQVGIGNVFNEKPPFSDTVFGYNGGLHSAWVMGRSYELSFNLPF